VRQPGAFDARTTFHFTVASGSSNSSPDPAPTRQTGLLLWGGVLVLLGGLCLFTSIPLRGWYTPVGVLVFGAGVVLPLAGLLVIALQLL
jgi:hypothetical protein